jgi:hypothetical protein
VTTLLALPLAAALAATPADLPASCREAAARAEPLGAWCATVAALPRLPVATAADREALRQVYARPELRRARADTAGFRRLLAGLWGRIVALLGTTEAERYASVGRTVFLASAMVAALAALGALRRRRGARAARPAAAGPVEAALPPPDRSAAAAEAALARGDLAGAVRSAFLSALAALEEAGRLPRDRTLTNRELASRLAADAPVARDFGALGRAFDDAIYGGAPVDAPSARASVELARRIRAGGGGPA